MEKKLNPISGWTMLVVVAGLLALAVYTFINAVIADKVPFIAILCGLAITFISKGFIAVAPNMSRVFTLFGSYAGKINDSGFYWVNPFFVSQIISLRAVTIEIPTLKVNDKQGNPVMIGAVMVFRVNDAFKAAFEVENYANFVKIQSESAVRKLAGMYSYDNLEDSDAAVTLRESTDEVNHQLAQEISDRLGLAGIDVIEARINHLAYATEIAGVMLQRQQATAVIAARSKIVEGAVGMVELALQTLSAKKIVELDDERKAAMVSNLLVVLCSDRAVNPVVNTGTLYQ
jgi:regulator of protease activity HflC (stomatin/prohibitin superfamily)